MSNVKLNFLVICEQVIQDADGKPSVIGIFHRIKTQGVPTIHPSFAIMANTYGVPGTYDAKLSIISPGGLEVTSASDKIKIPENGGNNWVIKFSGVVFPELGDYTIELKIGNQERLLTDPALHHVRVEKI